MNRRVGKSFALYKEGIPRGLKWAFSGGEPMSALARDPDLMRRVQLFKSNSVQSVLILVPSIIGTPTSAR